MTRYVKNEERRDLEHQESAKARSSCVDQISATRSEPVDSSLIKDVHTSLEDQAYEEAQIAPRRRMHKQPRMI